MEFNRLSNEEANVQMDKVMNAVKTLRQDLFQNDYCTGSAAYQEVVRMLFVKMVLDKEVRKEVDPMEDRFHYMKKQSLREKVRFERQNQQRPNYTKRDALNEVFRKHILNIDGESDFPKYENLFKKDEVIISSDEMIDKFIDRIEDINLVDLMDAGKDILGVVYETFIGEVQNPKAGQIFTPTDTVEFMLDLARITKDDVALDFCSGSGRFLTGSMRRMIEDARNTISDLEELERKIEEIKSSHVFGADIGSEPTYNTKRNMALAGDGSSQIANMNSLFITVEDTEECHIAHFHNGKGVNPEEVVVTANPNFDIKNCSKIPTNPPFGDLTFSYPKYSKEWIDEFRETFNKATWSELKRWKTQFVGILSDLTDKEDVKEKIDELIDLAPMDRNTAVEKVLVKMHKEIDKENNEKLISLVDELLKVGQRTVSTEVKEKRGEFELTGQVNYKGCLLFLYKAYQILKTGGQTIIVVDDGLLNTDSYAFARDFIRNKFFIKGVFSLSDKTFYAYSGKSIKTSILYLEKKPESLDADGDIFTPLQDEPVFYAHIEKVGMNTKRGKYESHFEEVKEGFFRFLELVNENKERNNGVFNPEEFSFEEIDINEEGEDNE